MGINDEYSRDAYTRENLYTSDSEDDTVSEVDAETWQDLYSDELIYGWEAVQDFVYDNTLTSRATYPKFVDLIVDPDHYSPRGSISELAERAWDRVYFSNTFIYKRVPFDNFCSWFDLYVTP